MSKGNPFAAFYYVKENRGRSMLCIFMMFLSVFLFLAGNFIHSVVYTFEKGVEYSDKLVVASLQSTDDEYRDWAKFRGKVMADEKLECVDSTAYGFGGMTHGSVLNLDLGEYAYVFNSAEDMEKVFAHLGIEGDFSHCGHGSIVISRDFANNRGIKLGDKVDHSFDDNLDGEYQVDAIIDDGSYTTFYVYEDDDSLGRLYIYSDSMEGEELYSYVENLAGGLKVGFKESLGTAVVSQFSVFEALYYGLDLLIAIVLAVTVNSVVTGQYLKRTYEFGIYRALGISRRKIKTKVADEILLMDGIACAVGIAVIFLLTYLLNELYYAPMGLHLLYYSRTGIAGFILCDALIVLPLILSKGRQMSRADVTEF